MISPGLVLLYIETNGEMVGFFLRGNKVLYKTYKINFYEFNQLLANFILRYGMIFLWMKADDAAPHLIFS